jgi:bifunctional non-homologous end joining protein LigD
MPPETDTIVLMRRSLSSSAFVEPMAAKLVDRLPEGDLWLYEVKWDGYRALLLKDDSRVQIRSRNNKDLTDDYPTLSAGAARLNAKRAIVDGEVVAVDANGRPSFQALQHRRAQPGHAIAFYAFDLLHLDGEDLLSLPLDERRALLPALLKGTGLLVSESLPGTASQVIEAVARLGLEGVIAKRRDSRHQSGERSGAWVKLKLDRQQEFVVGGYRPGNNGVDALLVGVYESKSLKFAGKVRAGMNPPVRRVLFQGLKPLHTEQCPFEDLPVGKSNRWGSGITAEELPELQWVKPRLVVQIRFVEWTAESQLRHSAFLAVRNDKPARGVTRET